MKRKEAYKVNSIVDRFIQGNFEYESGSLDFSCQKIELVLKKGETYKGSFVLSTDEEHVAEGTIMSSHLRMQCQTTQFSGQETVCHFSFHSDGMEEGEILRGEFHIISNKGEYHIPFVVTIEHMVLSSSLGHIKNLFHFANLAKSCWEEAVRLFYTPDFGKILTGNDRQYYNSYLGLSNASGNEQNVDEFLVEINKKQKTEYIPMESIIRIDAKNGISEGKITITKNGWGYTFLEISAEGDFLTIEKDTLSDHDFLGNLCSFSYYIDSSKLHAGNNFGTVKLTNPYFSTVVTFQVVNPIYKSLVVGVKKELRRLTLELMEFYCKFRMKKISGNVWLRESIKIVDRMNTIDEKSMTARLFKAQLLITEERYNEAKWLLEHIENDLEKEPQEPEIWCYYLYLTTLYNRDEVYVNEVTEEVESIYVRNSGNWRIAWLLLYLREDFSKSPSRKWVFLERQFLQNCTSPILYMEAVSLIQANPTLLMKLSLFEIQVLYFAAKHDSLNKEMIIQIHYLISKVKEFSRIIYEILEKCYEVNKDDETLLCICSLLIRGNKVGEQYFKWYALGVARELRITRLYEYYMMSLPVTFDEELPRIVLMYFAYHSDLSYEKKALLFANVMKNQNKYGDIIRTYQEPMEVFLVEQIKKGHINRELAYLYKNMLTPFMLRPEFADFLVPLLFTNMVTVTHPQMNSVVLRYDKVKGETVFPLQDGNAFIPIYSSEYKLLLQDDKGNRYATNIPYTIEKLMIPGKYLKDIGNFVHNHIGFDLYLCESSRNYVAINEKNVDGYQRLWESESVTEEFKKEIRLKLVEYYYNNDRLKEADTLLENIQPEGMDGRERAAFIHMLVARGYLDKAYDWICRYSEDQVEPYILVRLCSRLLIRREFQEDPVMLQVVFHGFKAGKYDDNILKYLLEYYSGLTKNMRDVWKAAKEFDLDARQICERILIQILYTGSYTGDRNEIFCDYVKLGSKQVIEVAFLTQTAYDYFVKDKVTEKSIFEHFTKLFHRGEKFHEVCKLAYLKYYCEHSDSLSEEIRYLITQFLDEFLQQRKYFPFFQELSDYIQGADEIMDLTMIEYRGNPKSCVMIHYVIEKDDDTDPEYCKEEMPHMYEGIFVKSFILFFGEKLQYYITEDTQLKEQLTESGTIQKSDILQGTKESKFSMINDMVTARTLQDYGTVHHMMEEYTKREFLVKDLFQIM